MERRDKLDFVGVAEVIFKGQVATLGVDLFRVKRIDVWFGGKYAYGFVTHF